MACQLYLNKIIFKNLMGSKDHWKSETVKSVKKQIKKKR